MFEGNAGTVSSSDPRCRFRHQDGEDSEGDCRDPGRLQKCGGVAEMVYDQTCNQSTRGGAETLERCYATLSDIVAASAVHQIRQQKRCDRAEDPGSDAVEQLHP